MLPSPSKSPHAAARVSMLSARPTAGATSSKWPWSWRYRRFGRPRKPTNSSRSPSLSKSAHAFGWPPFAENNSGCTSSKCGPLSIGASAKKASAAITGLAKRESPRLLGSERFERNNARGTASRKVARDERRGRQHRHRHPEHDRIERADVIQQAADEFP